jgi:hypothetical protein
MKKKMIQIVNELKLGDITTKEAKEELLALFGVGGSCLNCDPPEIDILRCKKCKGTDIIGGFSYLRCSDCGTTYSGSKH